MKKFILWCVTIFFALSAISFFPSFSSILFLIIAAVAAPINPIQKYVNKIIPKKGIKIAIVATAFIIGGMSIPTHTVPTNTDVDNYVVEETDNITTEEDKNTEVFKIDDKDNVEKTEPTKEETSIEAEPQQKISSPEPEAPEAPAAVEQPPVVVADTSSNTTSVNTSENSTYHESNQTQQPQESSEPVVTTQQSSTPTGSTVYITPTGKKYHYSLDCAGKNGSPTTLESASRSYGPCKKCAQ